MMRWKLIVLAGSLLTLTSCAAKSNVVPPISVAPKVSESQSLNAWLNGLVGAYIDNCITLRVLRNEDHTKCRELTE